jgi:hypothetical protein
MKTRKNRLPFPLWLRLALATLMAMVGVSLVVVAASFVNGDFSTGDETGWMHWLAPWGLGNWSITSSGPTPPEGTLFLGSGQTGNFGWFQRVPAVVSETYTLSGLWAGDIGDSGWAEVMFFSGTAGLSDADVIARIDAGNPADIAFKKDSWGMNPPTAWDWEPMALSPHPDGNGGVSHSLGEVVVAMKLGSTSGSPVSVSFDELSIVDSSAVTLMDFRTSRSGGITLLTVGLVVSVAGLASAWRCIAGRCPREW